MKEEKLCPRFVYEYANYQKRHYENLTGMRPDIAFKSKEIIDNAVRLRERGKITLTEAMDIITYPDDIAVKEINSSRIACGYEPIEI